VGEAELVRSEVKAIRAGRITEVSVRPMQHVAAGEQIARLHPVDPAVLAASVAVIRAEVDFQRASLGPELGPRRLVLHAARLRLDWLRERVTLAGQRVQLQQAEVELARLHPLRTQGTVSEQAFDAARLLRDRLAASTSAQQELVESLAPSVADLPSAPEDGHEVLAAAVRLQEQRLHLVEAQLAPIVLTAPIAGVVSSLPIAEGVLLTEGSLAATITSTKPTRIVGHLRQPLSCEPREGLRVSVRSRSGDRITAETTVVEVGRALEPVAPTVLALFNRANVPELGLRVQLALPPALHLHPGEQVDVVISDL
jgi:multidrug resistance efflux pump